MIKLNLECWWTDSNSLNARIIRQFLSQEDLKNYTLTSENPDFTIVFGRTEWDKIKTQKERTFYFSQEPLWSPNQPKNDIHNYCSRIFISDKRDYPDREEYIETLLPMFYAGRGENDTREEWDWSYKIKDKKYEKNKKISMIVTKNGSEHYTHLCNPETSKINYEFRTKLGIELSNNKEIDIFGTHWENNGKNIKGEVWNKHVALDEYVFSVACENSIQKNYISEKFWDVILTNGVPIYLGCNNIYEYIPKDCYVSLNKIKYVEENYLDYYNFYKNNIFKLKSDFFKNPSYNLWERIKKEIQNA
jgi:hypothetical protein